MRLARPGQLRTLPSIAHPPHLMDSSDHFALARARHALATAGLPDDASLVRANSTRNEVFVGDRVVVRVNRQPNQRLRREAELCRFLPNERWAPRVLAYGGQLGADFLVVERLPGAPLAQSWPLMSTVQRREATAQLAWATAQLHATPMPATVPRIENLPYLIDPRCVTPLLPLLMGLATLRKRGIDSGLISAAEAYVAHSGDALADYDQRNMIHGDLTFENMLWDGSQLTALLDFEWCRGGPLDMELDVLFRMAAFPYAHVGPDLERMTRAEDYADLPSWLVEFRPDLFRHPRLADRLRLYALAFDIKELLDHPVDVNGQIPVSRSSNIGPLHPLNRMSRLLTFDSYLDRTMARIGLRV